MLRFKDLTRPSRGLPRIAVVVALGWLMLAGVLRMTTSLRSSFYSMGSWWQLRHRYMEFNDSWLPMQMAFDRFESGQIANLYELIGSGIAKFQYPPSSLLLHAAVHGAGASLSTAQWNWTVWFAIGVTTLLTAFLWVPLTAKLPPTNRFSGSDQFWLVVATFVFVLLFYPLFKAYTQGQAQAWIDMLFVMAVWAWLYERKATAGVLVGLICLVKPQLSLLVPWALLRGEKRFVAGWAGSFGVGLILSLWRFGLANQLEYLQVLGRIARVGETYFPNQSINGLLNRLMFNGDSVGWSPGGFPTFHPVVYAGTLATSLAMIAFVMLWRRREAPDALDFGFAALVFTMASPIAWEHHYGLLPPVALLLLFNLARIRDRHLRNRACLFWLVSWLVCSLFFPLTNRWAGSYLNVFQSTLLFGAFGLVFLSVWHRRHPDFGTPEIPDANKDQSSAF